MFVPIAATVDAAATAGPTFAAIDQRTCLHSGTTTAGGQTALPLAIPVAVFDHMDIRLMPAGPGPMMVRSMA